MEDLTGHPILLISARWQTRALLAAELGERVVGKVVSVADANAALGAIKLGGFDPAVVVVDASRQMGLQDVERLLEATPRVRCVLVASRLRREAFDVLRERCAAYLERPVRVGTVAQAVVQVLQEQETRC